jgi:hypothetical protein
MVVKYRRVCPSRGDTACCGAADKNRTTCLLFAYTTNFFDMLYVRRAIKSVSSPSPPTSCWTPTPQVDPQSAGLLLDPHDWRQSGMKKLVRTMNTVSHIFHSCLPHRCCFSSRNSQRLVERRLLFFYQSLNCCSWRMCCLCMPWYLSVSLSVCLSLCVCVCVCACVCLCVCACMCAPSLSMCVWPYWSVAGTQHLSFSVVPTSQERVKERAKFRSSGRETLRRSRTGAGDEVRNNHIYIYIL